MRIIAGKFGSRKLKTPNPQITRPTTDRNREAIFNYLTNRIDFDGIKVCDIYSGSGALGLESLSRGASEAHFIDVNFGAVKILKENIASLDAAGECRIFKMSAVKFSSMSAHEKYDLIIADPPFFKYDVYGVCENILKNEFLTANGIFLIERSKQTSGKDIEKFGKEPFKKLGDSFLYIFHYS